MFNKKNKKGLTIAVIVIAVIAILVAVLIPTIGRLIAKENPAIDNSLVKSINAQLAIAEQRDGKNTTMYDALLDAKEAGYIVSKINAWSNNQLIWDETIDRFALIDAEGNLVAGEIKATNNVNLWKISKNVDDTYSTYYIGTEKVINTSNGFDAGDVEGITEINYSNSGASKSVVIRTNGGTLTINAPLDTVKHYGDAQVITLTAVDNNSYYEHGSVNLVNIKKGRLVITNDAKAEVDMIYLSATNKAYDGIILATQSGSTLPDVVAREFVELPENGSKLVVTIQTDVNAEGQHPTKTEEIYLYPESDVKEVEKGYDVSDLGLLVVEAISEEAKEQAGGQITNSELLEVVEKTKTTELETITEKATLFAGGKGTAEKPYRIGNVDDLIALSNKVAGGESYAGKYFIMTADIDMKDVPWGVENGDETIYCIGTKTTPFSGNFNGQGHNIENLSNNKRNAADEYTAPTSGSVGGIFALFGYIKGDVTIQNVNIYVDANVSDSEGTAGLISIVEKTDDHKFTINIENVKIYGLIVANEKAAGFIYANNDNKEGNKVFNFKNCVNYATITSRSKTSGFFSQPQNYDVINFVNCQNKGNISITKESDGTYSSYTGYGVAAGFISNVQGATVNYDSKSVNNGIIEAPLAVNYHAPTALKMNNGIWNGKVSCSYNMITRAKGVIMTESSKAYAKFAEDELKLPHAFDGLLYKTNNEYVVEVSSSTAPAGTARYTAEEWADVSTNLNYGTGAADTIANSTAPLTIKLLYDLTWNRTLNFTGSGRPIVIDLNGHTLTVSATMFSGQNGYSIKYQNGEIQVHESIDILSTTGKGTVTYENVTGDINKE